MPYLTGNLFVTGGAGDISAELVFPTLQDDKSLIRIKRLETYLEITTKSTNCAAGLFLDHCEYRLQQDHDEMDITPVDGNCIVTGQVGLMGVMYDNTRQFMGLFLKEYQEHKVRGYFRVTGRVYFVAHAGPSNTDIFYKVEYDIKDIGLLTQVQIRLMGGG